MFNGMISSIPVPVQLDSIQIMKSTVTYRELGVNKDESGDLSIKNINGVITGFTNISYNQERIETLEAILTANLNGYAKMHIDLVVPYDKEAFQLAVNMGRMELDQLNPMVVPLAGVKIKSGSLKKLKFEMNAGPNHSQNSLIFDYSDLHVDLVKEKENHKFKKRPIISMIANAAVKNNNFPEHHNYLTATYQTERNRYRSPVNYIVQGVVQGAARIVPGKNIGNAVTKDKKKKQKKKAEK